MATDDRPGVAHQVLADGEGRNDLSLDERRAVDGEQVRGLQTELERTDLADRTATDLRTAVHFAALGDNVPPRAARVGSAQHGRTEPRHIERVIVP